jgi:hypothetical protein
MGFPVAQGAQLNFLQVHRSMSLSIAFMSPWNSAACAARLGLPSFSAFNRSFSILTKARLRIATEAARLFSGLLFLFGMQRQAAAYQPVVVHGTVKADICRKARN